MTECEYISELCARWPRNSDATIETIAFADEAVLAFPDSPKLWCMRGDLIQLAVESCPHSLRDAEASYLRAIAIDPAFLEAHREAANLYDAVMPNDEKAAFYFAQVRRLQEEGASSLGSLPPSP